MNIDFVNLHYQYQYQLYKTEIDEAMYSVLDKSNYIMGEEITELEEFSGAKYAISCSNGTDTLLLSMMVFNVKLGNEIITTLFTAETIAFLGVITIFVDLDEKIYNIDASKIEEKITSKTKVIMPVSHYARKSLWLAG